VRGTVGTGFRAPRPGELGGPYGNSALQPEKVHSWDFGADVSVVPGYATLSATVFQNHFDQMIGFDLNTFHFANFVKVKTSGLELEGSYQPLQSLIFRATYTYLKTQDETTGLDLLRRPKNSGSINIDYRWRHWGFNYNWNLIGNRFDINDVVFPPERISNDAYNRADLIVSYQIVPDLQVYGRVLNLWNENYQEVFGYQAPDRGFLFGVKLN
jgi:vitamin B12 transporter